MSEYRRLGSIMSQINVTISDPSRTEQQQNLSDQFTSNQNKSHSDQDSFFQNSESNLASYNESGKDPGPESQKKISELKKGNTEISNDTPNLDNPPGREFKANEDASQITSNSKPDDEPGMFSELFQSMKDEAKSWMMGKLQDGLNELMNSGETSEAGDQITGIQKSEKKGVGKIPVIDGAKKTIPYETPSPNIPQGPKLPSPNFSKVSLPKLMTPKIPKF